MGVLGTVARTGDAAGWGRLASGRGTRDSEVSVVEEGSQRTDPREDPADLVDTGPLGALGTSITSAYGMLITPRLAPYGVTLIQFGMLNYCFRGQADTATGLADLIPIDAASLSRNVDKLVKTGLLQRRRSQSDRRVVNLELTDEGTALVREVTHIVREVNAVLLSGVSQEEKRCLMGVVRKIAANSERHAS
jgi:DNA-binding MarR family transcriptional regulator